MKILGTLGDALDKKELINIVLPLGFSPEDARRGFLGVVWLQTFTSTVRNQE
jgi:hypothetical protein